MDSANTPPAHPFRPHLQLNNSMAVSQLDEGYSDGADTRSQPDSEMVFSSDAALERFDSEVKSILRSAISLSEDARKELLLSLIPTLDNKNKLELKKFIEHLTHFDPAHYLPAELVLNIFSHLSAKDLLTASCVSRAWRAKTHDQKLWRGCFAKEGWVLDKSRMEQFEREAEAEMKASRAWSKRRSQRQNDVAGPSLERKESRKRTRVEAFSDGETSPTRMEGVDGAGDVEFEAQETNAGEGMEGVETTISSPSSRTLSQEEVAAPGLARGTHDAVPGTTIPGTTGYEAYQRRYSFDNISTDNRMFPSLDLPPSPQSIQLTPTLLANGTHKVSWEYLYKHRHRLEDNWDKGRYSMFTLPHVNHPEEGHTECVYTIQHTAKHLVSGSRDKSIRIWDLDSGRLKMHPLQGHQASVLCLQFDEREGQDIIVSGGSDAMVIIWKFSTGEIVKMLQNAHEESVLNLRFDDRYIVTCSKDKTIKVWNRQAVERSPDSPDIPKHVISEFMEPSLCLGGLGPMIEPFTLLTTLKSHHAAVNAVMIHDNTIVSASGDRTIKAWNLHTGKVTRTYAGHTKGIACVQFDGRRVVSGSSDNTVRVFDAENMAEVACLQGHSNLVRTVQARFGDLDIVSAEELEEQARVADRNFLRALNEGMAPASIARGARRNAGSSRPEDMLSVGARIPPGGGGSRWAKIVSGSYDESVIVWKKRRDGKWVIRQQLHQSQLLRQTRVRRQPAVPAPVAPLPAAQPDDAAAALGVAQNGLAAAQHANAVLQQQQQAQNGAINGATFAIGAQIAQVGAIVQNIHMQTAQAAGAPPANALAPVQQQAQQNWGQGANGVPPPNPPPQVQPGHGGGIAAAANAVHAALANAANNHGHGGRNDSMRVFKLQFDARRIICCSQNKVIVGWDFAAGDKALEMVGSWSLETP